MGIVSMYLMGSIARIVKKRSYRTQVAQTVGLLSKGHNGQKERNASITFSCRH